MVCTKMKNTYIRHSHGMAQYYPTHHNSQYKHQQQVFKTPAMLVPIDVTINAKSIQACSYTPTCTLPKPGRPGTFQEHVLQLDPWEYSLLNNVTLTQDPFTITSIFMSQVSPLQAAMDGSITNANGTFGWVISTIDETRLIMCQGAVYRRAPTSYHTKCYRLLPLLRFLLQLHLYTEQLTLPFEIYTDCQSLIATISHLSKWTLHFPSTTSQPDWNILQAITTTLQKLHTRPTFNSTPGLH